MDSNAVERDANATGSSAGKVAALVAVTLAWIALDQWTKSAFGDMEAGQTAGEALGGLVKFVLVHNTGGAWGVFSGNPVALGAFSCVVCCVLAGYFFISVKSLNWPQTLGIALIVAGGIGNAIDRFAQGYVTDFIAVTFVDFPVFNVADIGVTCGVVILFAGIFLSWRRESPKQDTKGDER